MTKTAPMKLRIKVMKVKPTLFDSCTSRLRRAVVDCDPLRKPETCWVAAEAWFAISAVERLFCSRSCLAEVLSLSNGACC